MSIARRESPQPVELQRNDTTMKMACSQTCGAVAGMLLSGSLVFAQGVGGYAPGVNPSNPNDMTLRANPNNMTLPGAGNPHDLVRSRSGPKTVPPRRTIANREPVPASSSLAHTYTAEPAKKAARRARHAAGP